MSTFNTGAYPPGCTQRDVDEAQPGYWDERPALASEEEEAAEAWEYWHQRAIKLEADLHATLKAVLYHFGPEGAHKVTTSALASGSQE